MINLSLNDIILIQVLRCISLVIGFIDMSFWLIIGGVPFLDEGLMILNACLVNMRNCVSPLMNIA